MLLRPTFLYSPLLAALCWTCSASDSTPVPAPIACTPSTLFLGDDGNWSPINIQVGTGPQYVSVLPNTASQETWVIGPGGCDGTYTCQRERGGLFNTAQSSTWTSLGDYRLGIDPQFNNEDYGGYGLDVVALNSEDSLDGQIVAVLNTTDFWLGQLGLGVQHPQFNDGINRLTLLSSLVEEASLIPSHSFGYTAGAYYRLRQVPASLTLGGVDTNRFSPNTATFPLDLNQKPSLAVNKITVSASSVNAPSFPDWSANPLTLLEESESALFTIDSSTPFLWLPETVCDAFAAALGLVYNETLQLYFFGSNGTSPTDLQSWSLLFVFSMSDYPGSSTNSVRLSLPYSAFDLQLSFPYPGLDANVTSSPTNYFPLRKATSPDQYTLGRTFLQETYLTVDYERNNFSISQARFSLDALTNINLVPISRPANSNYTGPHEPASSSSGLSTGAWAGVGVGVAVLGAVITTLAWYVFRIKKNKKAERLGKRLTDKESSDEYPTELSGDTAQRSFTELPASRRFPAEAPVDSSHTRSEMPGIVHVPLEMAALEEVPAAFLAPSRNVNEKNALALAQNRTRRDSMQKGGLDVPKPARLSPQPQGQIPPPYSPSTTNEGRQSSSNGISPNSPHHSGRIGRGADGTNTTSSSDRIVSPVTETSGSGHSPNLSGGPETPVPFSPLVAPTSGSRSASASATVAFPARLDERVLMDGYRLRGTSPVLRPEPGNVDEEGVELDERLPVPADQGRRRFSWEGSEV